jgi:predicted nucleic acid-binding protein
MKPRAPDFLNTNILIYAFTDDERSKGAQSLLAEPFIINVQALNELANVGRRKLKMSWDEIESAIAAILALANAVVPIDEKITLEAIRLAARYNVSFYDAAMVAAALHAGCERCYSEDLHDGLVVDGRLKIIYPFTIGA